MIVNYQTRIRRLYRHLAPVYASLRPIWTAVLGRSAEDYLETKVLPAILTPTTSVLDLGCGPAINLARLQRLGLPFARYVGIDLSPHMLTAWSGASATAFVLGDAGQLPFAAGSFDLILSTWLFSHLPNPGAIVREALRTLHPGGWLVVECFVQPSGALRWWLRPVEKAFFMRCVSPDEFRTWPGQVEVKFFAGGCNTVVRLHKIAECEL